MIAHPQASLQAGIVQHPTQLYGGKSRGCEAVNVSTFLLVALSLTLFSRCTNTSLPVCTHFITLWHHIQCTASIEPDKVRLLAELIWLTSYYFTLF